ncbi:MAG: SseB family protein [Thermoanaerobaculia bacterium]|nr:SseB family protein [Thermoanaerobaculia bacterium]
MVTAARRDTIDARHADGIVRPTSRQAFRTDVLPSALKAFRTVPDRLAEAILTAVEAGLASDVGAAAEHLGRIDPDRRRRTWIPALVLCLTGKFKRAEEVIVRGRELFGDSADFRFVEAEILFARHLRAKGEAALAEALNADPNHSRALRSTLDHYREAVGVEASHETIASVATRAGAWRARLLLSEARFSAGDFEEARRLAAEASECGPGGEVIGPLSAVLARQNDSAGLLELVQPRYDPSRHGPRCGVNLLFALLDQSRRDEGQVLLAALGSLHPGAFEKHRAFYASAFAAIEPGSTNDPRAHVALHRALASYARHETPSTRRAMVGKLLASVLLLPLRRPVVDVPILDLGLPEAADPSIEPISAIDSTGKSVTLAFTSPKALASWDTRHRHRISLDAREVMQLLRTMGGGALVIDAAGPASLELSPEQVEAILEAKEIPESGGNAPFVVEPLREDLPAAVVDEAELLTRGTEGVREGFLFQLVAERSGAAPAFAILFDDSADERARREAVLEAQDRLVWESGRKRRRLQVLPVTEGPLAEYLRVCAVRVG